MENNRERANPLGGLAPWVGGKRNLARRLIARIEAVPHTCYAEPFIGMGGVFLRRAARAKVEAINDASAEVANLFRIVQRHPEALFAEIAWRVTSRTEFERLVRQDPAGLTEIERAARFLYIQYCGFGGRPTKPTFGLSAYAPARWNTAQVRARLAAVHERIATTYIERLDFQEFIRRWDRPQTLMYLDPPYYGCEGYYGAGLFARSDYERLAGALQGLKGRFILSLNDHPEVRSLFAWADIEAVPVTYKLNGTKRVTELIIQGGGG